VQSTSYAHSTHLFIKQLPFREYAVQSDFKRHWTQSPLGLHFYFKAGH